MLDPYPAKRYGRAIELLESGRDVDEGLGKAVWELMHAGGGHWKSPGLRERHDALWQAIQQRETALEKDRSMGRTEAGCSEAKRLELELRSIHEALRAELGQAKPALSSGIRLDPSGCSRSTRARRPCPCAKGR